MRLCNGCGGAKPRAEFTHDAGYAPQYCLVCQELRKYEDETEKFTTWTDSPFILHIDAFKNMKNTPSDSGYIFFIKQSSEPYIFIDHALELPNTLNTIRKYFFEDLILLLAIPGTTKSL